MKTTTINISELNSPKKNVRVHPETQVKELAKAVEMFGQIRPIVIDETNTVLAGNGLMAALKSLGKKEASVFKVSGLSDAKKKKLMLVDNKVYSLGFDDFETQMEFLTELSAAGDFDVPAFDPDVIKSFAMDNSDVDSEINAYGSDFAPPKAESVENSGRPEDRPESGGSTLPNYGDLPDEKSDLDAGKIVCPNCGEIIWVK